MAATQGCYRRMRSENPRLIETYCGACGLLIGASPRSRILTLLESIHICPVRGYYGDANGLRKLVRLVTSMQNGHAKVTREPT